MKFKIFSIILLLLINILKITSQEDIKIDWQNGKIYSYVNIHVKNDNNFANNQLKGVNSAKNMAKINFYKALKKINIYQSLSVLEYLEERADKNRELFSLINKAKLYKVEYPDINTIKFSYYINIFGDNSLMGIMISERDIYTEELQSYMGYHYETNYSGVIIDARGILKSFDDYDVKVKPALFITVKDTEGRLVFNQNNVLPEVIRNKGMLSYSYDINDDHSERVGNNPFKIVASGTGDRSGSVILINEMNAKRLLSSLKIRNAIKNGNIVVIIDK